MSNKQGSSSQKTIKVAPLPPEETYIDWGEPLPENYEDTRIILMPRDPRWAYAYWEITNCTKEKIKEKYGKEVFQKSRLTLRIYDVTDIQFDGQNANRYFDIGITEHANNWYINMGIPARSYCVDLGLLTLEGGFVTIVRSNVIYLPRETLSSVTDQAWMQIRSEFDKLMKLAGLDKTGISSAEAMKILIQRVENIAPISSGGISSGGSVVSWGKMKKIKKFWLMADAELIVYGATERDAQLTVQGQPIELKPDGTFSLRFALPDGKQEIPIVAVSKDKTDTQKITITVQRKTE